MTLRASLADCQMMRGWPSSLAPDQLEIYTLHADNTMVRAFSADLNDVAVRRGGY